MSSHFVVECLDCSHQSPFNVHSSQCPKCGSSWRTTVYDFEKLKKSFLVQIQSRPFDLWRYRELLPVRSPNPELTLGEGGTPLIRASNLGMMLGCPHIYIKDERQGPTSSFKDRQAAVTISALKEAGITEAVIASTGNVAIAYSAYAARAGIKLWAFITSLVPPVKMHEVALYGTQVIKVTGNYDQTKQVAAEFAKQRGLYIDQGVRSITTVDSMKTISFEIAEQITQLIGPPVSTQDGQLPEAPWRSPDWYIQAVSGGLGPIGVLKGFQELRKMELINQIPAIANIQTEGCAPMVHAWKNNKSVAEPVKIPRTHIATLATGDPGRSYTLLREEMLNNNGGTFESVTDQEAYRAMHVVAKMEGLSIEPATAVAFAGMINLIRADKIKPTDVVVINCTGHTVPVEQSVLGEGWAKDVEYPAESAASETIPEDGILAALNRVTADRYPRVAIVDDHPDVRLLVRRILQSQGSYELLEATDGKEALELISREIPDLVILDLMMPEIDGFSVLDQLRNNPDTAKIPVIVITAKELTNQEKDRLKGQIQSLMQKGNFMDDEFLDEVKSLVS